MNRRKKGKERKLSGSLDIDQAIQSALKYHERGRLDRAERIYRNILKNHPDQPDALHFLGLMAGQRGKADEAEHLMRKAVEILPQNAIYQHNFGTLLKEQGRWEEAVHCYQEAVKLEPSYVEAHYNMGDVYLNEGNLPQAIFCFQKALDLIPDFAEAHGKLGFAFQKVGNLGQAISCYSKAVEIRPDFAEAWNSMGLVFFTIGAPDKAVSCYQKAMEISSNAAEPYHNLGDALQQMGNLEEAVSCYKKAIDLDPEYGGVYFALFNTYKQMCAWKELENLKPKLDTLTKDFLFPEEENCESPFQSVITHPDPSRNLAVARLKSSNISKETSKLGVHFTVDKQRYLRKPVTVAYLSSDFHDHATAHLMLSLFDLHNRDEFKILCYSYGGHDESRYRKKIQQDCDKFVDVSKLSYTEAAERIYEARVGILVDLKGYTLGGRMHISALCPAPVQVSYLGFPGTTGSDFLDYIITDRIVTPEDQASYYTEQFVYMPHCYQVNDQTQVIAKKRWSKSDFGLPENNFVFCSFNQGYKIDSEMFRVWMNVLAEVPSSVLWLFAKDKNAEVNLRREAQARGVNPERLIFATKLPKDKHLRRLQLADLAVDTRIYNGHTTTSDTLWAGTPVITMQGTHFASRVSSSILMAIGLPELVTYNLEEYEKLAVRLAHNSDQLDVIRRKLEKNRSVKPLFDTTRFVRNLERAYKEMWEIFLAGKRPRQIEVVEN